MLMAHVFFSEHQKLPDFGLQVEQLRHQQI